MPDSTRSVPSTTTPAGKAMFQMLGVFAEFERAIIRERVVAGMARAKANGTKSGKRPRLMPSYRGACPIIAPSRYALSDDGG